MFVSPKKLNMVNMVMWFFMEGVLESGVRIVNGK